MCLFIWTLCRLLHFSSSNIHLSGFIREQNAALETCTELVSCCRGSHTLQCNCNATKYFIIAILSFFYNCSAFYCTRVNPITPWLWCWINQWKCWRPDTGRTYRSFRRWRWWRRRRSTGCWTDAADGTHWPAHRNTSQSAPSSQAGSRTAHTTLSRLHTHRSFNSTLIIKRLSCV